MFKRLIVATAICGLAAALSIGAADDQEGEEGGSGG